MAPDRLGPPEIVTLQTRTPLVDVPNPPQPTDAFHKNPLTHMYERLKFGNPHFQLLAGDNSLELARAVGSLLKNKRVPDTQPPFKNGEITVNVPPQLYKTSDVYIIESTVPHPHKSFTQLVLLANAAKHAGVNSVTAIVPHLGYSRQDRIDIPGAPQSGKLMAEMILDAGSHHRRRPLRRHKAKLATDARLIVVDVHATDPLKEVTADNGYQWANLDAGVVLLPKVQQLIQDNQLDVAVAFPDHGAEERYKGYADVLVGGVEHAAVIDKVRNPNVKNEVTIRNTQESLTHKVAGKDVLLFDDIIDTGGSIKQAAIKLKEDGAKSVRVIATHGIFSADAMDKLHHPAIDGVIITNTIHQLPEVTEDPHFTIVDIAPLIAQAIERIEKREPLGELVKEQSEGFEKSYKTWKVNRERRRAQTHHPN